MASPSASGLFLFGDTPGSIFTTIMLFPSVQCAGAGKTERVNRPEETTPAVPVGHLHRGRRAWNIIVHRRAAPHHPLYQPTTHVVSGPSLSLHTPGLFSIVPRPRPRCYASTLS
ncbi:hypothetical protein CABS03_04709 [Colletotrichum abscissum]|uniref:Uncharacterized protein n=3 Tax=Colletotrichum acutatum species complex TaxID=2707335 RepID=A0A9P9XER9_9PEZI|nr:uncharacterized protein CCOS01_02646 [Colletotrichum costaricense]XP_060383237.1 uncharacterized protein CTAM01_06017 [Colletotrichum tamarilloi]KAI3539225.1 hypothetical protein CSPX01_09124 [Colletotrichum filicis]KAI3549439.1 hypothetical protein CABS02_07903 [Colletotrichum abscissum]KAK1501292.1 hypothetical protein CTAM01_06017 [Colletotrichum tamarilloi]KAK1537326.1 hypothetical protein CCOS01_02646 [Colletotrichum costaricense]